MSNAIDSSPKVSYPIPVGYLWDLKLPSKTDIPTLSYGSEQCATGPLDFLVIKREMWPNQGFCLNFSSPFATNSSF